MSSSFTYTFTNARNFPWSVNRCFFSSGCCAVRFCKPSATVPPDTSSAAFFSAYCRSGVGIWIFIVYLMDVYRSWIVSNSRLPSNLVQRRSSRAKPSISEDEPRDLHFLPPTSCVPPPAPPPLHHPQISCPPPASRRV